jgi:hypothetical protein
MSKYSLAGEAGQGYEIHKIIDGRRIVIELIDSAVATNVMRVLNTETADLHQRIAELEAELETIKHPELSEKDLQISGLQGKVKQLELDNARLQTIIDIGECDFCGHTDTTVRWVDWKEKGSYKACVDCIPKDHELTTDTTPPPPIILASETDDKPKLQDLW